MFSIVCFDSEEILVKISNKLGRWKQAIRPCLVWALIEDFERISGEGDREFIGDRV